MNLQHKGKPAKPKTEAERIAEGLRAMPENKMLLAAQELQNVLLPKVRAARGDKHPDTVFFEEVRDCLIYSLHILSRYTDLVREYQNKKMMLEFFMNRNSQLEKELDKYHAVEDMEMLGALDDYRATIKDRAMDILNNLPNGNNTNL